MQYNWFTVEKIDAQTFAISEYKHWDHIGGHKYFPDFSVHEDEVTWISGQFPIPLQVIKKNLTLKRCDFPADFCLKDYQIFKGNPAGVLHDGDFFDLGNRTLQVIHTPGHSPGHCCFYEQDKGWLYSGDYSSLEIFRFKSEIQLPACR